MPKDLAVFCIHGMGSHAASFAEPLVSRVSRQLRAGGKDPSRVTWRSVHWGPIVDGREAAYFERTKSRYDRLWHRLRRFVIDALGDPAAYHPVISRSQDRTVYEKTHKMISDEFRELYRGDLDGREVPLVILAHSLGGHIISNYIWDLQHGRSVARHELSGFERMNTLTRLITFGCNIPLFTFAYPDAKPIEFPSAEMSKCLQQKARWLNFHNPADLLGYPLSPISRDYENSAIEDIQLRNGGFPLMWTPLAHIRYWKDRRFAGVVAEQIVDLLEDG